MDMKLKRAKVQLQYLEHSYSDLAHAICEAGLLTEGSKSEEELLLLRIRDSIESLRIALYKRGEKKNE